ncbi:MAG: adenosylmethionine decarboxylase [Candidatus Tectomicrobia bacterium]|nr:adenosylmethionine decarboxylase [Candidatus Tectomicrobia bacterium]
MKALGRHLLVEYFDCDREILNDAARIEEAMTEAADKSGATIVNSVFHLFSPHGVSGVVVIAESHLAIHTWPEYGFAAVDFFSCGEGVTPEAAVLSLQKALKAASYESREVPRGQIGVTSRVLRHKPEAITFP